MEDTDVKVEETQNPDWVEILGISWLILLGLYLFFMLIIVAAFSLVDTPHWMTTMGWWATGLTVVSVFILGAIYAE